MRPAAVRTQRKSSNSPKISTSPGGDLVDDGSAQSRPQIHRPGVHQPLGSDWRVNRHDLARRYVPHHTVREPDSKIRRRRPQDGHRCMALEETQRLAAGGRAAAQCTVGDLYASPATHHSRVGRHDRRLAPRLREKMTRINGSLAARINAEMQMRARRASVAGVAHTADDIAGLDPRPLHSFLHLKMGVVERDRTLLVAQPNHIATELSLLHPTDVRARCRNGQRAARREDVDPVMLPPAGVARRAESTPNRAGGVSFYWKLERCHRADSHRIATAAEELGLHPPRSTRRPGGARTQVDSFPPRRSRRAAVPLPPCSVRGTGRETREPEPRPRDRASPRRAGHGERRSETRRRWPRRHRRMPFRGMAGQHPPAAPEQLGPRRSSPARGRCRPGRRLRARDGRRRARRSADRAGGRSPRYDSPKRFHRR